MRAPGSAVCATVDRDGSLHAVAVSVLALFVVICFTGLLVLSDHVARLEQRVAWLCREQGHE